MLLVEQRCLGPKNVIHRFDFNFKVFVQLRGTLGKSAKQQLIKKSENEADAKSSFVFKRASSETFFLHSNDIGDLIALEIEVYFYILFIYF